MSYCIQKPKKSIINEHKKLKIMENLHFLPNNVLTRLFKELKNIYKWLSIMFKLYM